MEQMNIVNNFIHKVGQHCESSAMRDLLEFYGFTMTEAMVFGLDATMGFGFFDTTNYKSFIPISEIFFFLGGKQGTINPNSLACRLLGIKMRKQSYTDANKAWEESKKFINQNIPLILRIDLGYLPYFEEKGNFHFGGHTITLAGYDDEEEFAFVGDTEFKGFQKVPISQLKKGRSSEFGPKFMHPHNTQFSMQRRGDEKHPPLSAGVKLAIQEVANNMLRPSMNNMGIQGLKLFANSIPKWKEKLQGEFINATGEKVSRARIMFELIHGYIETWGTGGAIFRNLYKEFLEELINYPLLRKGSKAWSEEEFKILKDCIPLISDSATSWTLIAETLKNAVNKHEDTCLDTIDTKELQNIVLFILKREEELFLNLLKIRI